MKRVIPIAALLIGVGGPAPAQFAGRTCGPNGCHLILPAPPPTPTLFLRSVCGRAGKLVIAVAVLNENQVPVLIDTQTDRVKVTMDGKASFPQFVTSEPGRALAPHEFLSQVIYRATLSGQWPQSMAIQTSEAGLTSVIDTKSVNDCL